LVFSFDDVALRLRPLVPCAHSSAELLLAAGTIPMYYGGQRYNIPVEFWLPERFPLAAPICYVKPTPDMMIWPNHAFVDSSGERPAPPSDRPSRGCISVIWTTAGQLR
jgi:ESCRT-I complex subunit TSG101